MRGKGGDKEGWSDTAGRLPSAELSMLVGSGRGGPAAGSLSLLSPGPLAVSSRLTVGPGNGPAELRCQSPHQAYGAVT